MLNWGNGGHAWAQIVVEFSGVWVMVSETGFRVALLGGSIVFSLLWKCHIGSLVDSGNDGCAAKMRICIAWAASGAAVVVAETASADWENIYEGFACYECWALAFPRANQLTTYTQFLGFVQAWSNHRIWWKEWLKNLWWDRRSGQGSFWCSDFPQIPGGASGELGRQWNLRLC